MLLYVSNCSRKITICAESFCVEMRRGSCTRHTIAGVRSLRFASSSEASLALHARVAYHSLDDSATLAT
jgi:hypothetical protein